MEYNEVKDILDQIPPQRILIKLLETYVEGLDETVQAKIYETDGVFTAEYSHYDRKQIEPSFDAYTDLHNMESMTTRYLKAFKSDDVEINEEF